jgi:predicted nucleic-acid-binding Zn-ribbon protein
MTGSVECPKCKQWYDPQSSKQLIYYTCPSCGYQTTEFRNIRVSGTGNTSARVTEVETKSSQIKKNSIFDAIVLIVTVGAPLACYFVLPILGVVLGLSTGLFNYWLTPKAKKWFIETTHVSVR